MRPSLLALALLACGGGGGAPAAEGAGAAKSPAQEAAAATRAEAAPRADVLAVRVSGPPGERTFFVTVRSPDTGCDRYADWWEVVRPDGTLVYRRVLLHSHPGEQPFTRSGGPVPVGDDEEVLVRAHMRPGGYGGAAMRGTAAAGFRPAPDLGADFAADLERADPQPPPCAF